MAFADFWDALLNAGKTALKVEDIAAGTPYKNIDVDESEDAVSAVPCVLRGFHAINSAVAARYLKLYNKTPANVTVGTTVPDLTFLIPASSQITWDVPINFTVALTVAATTAVGDADAGAPSANDVMFNGVYA